MSSDRRRRSAGLVRWLSAAIAGALLIALALPAGPPRRAA